jgi:hypothetical protein
MAEDNPDYCGPEGNRLREEAQRYAEERHIHLDASKKAFEDGDKQAAKELSDKGKEAGQKMEEANKLAAIEILKFNNDGHPDNYLDLHGLLLEEALAAFRERVELLKSRGESIVFEAIPGAGHHSKGKAIIKPKIIEETESMGLRFEEKNAGTILIYINEESSSTVEEVQVVEEGQTIEGGQVAEDAQVVEGEKTVDGVQTVEETQVVEEVQQKVENANGETVDGDQTVQKEESDNKADAADVASPSDIMMTENVKDESAKEENGGKIRGCCIVM